jgi:hypothetical protein
VCPVSNPNEHHIGAAGQDGNEVGDGHERPTVRPVARALAHVLEQGATRRRIIDVATVLTRVRLRAIPPAAAPAGFAILSTRTATAAATASTSACDFQDLNKDDPLAERPAASDALHPTRPASNGRANTSHTRLSGAVSTAWSPPAASSARVSVLKGGLAHGRREPTADMATLLMWRLTASADRIWRGGA